MNRLPVSRDPLLFTPGPLTTSLAVKAAMLHDQGSWHDTFRAIVAKLRRRLLAVAELPCPGEYEVILMQGSGTFGLESVLGTVIPADGKLLVLANGAYGERMAKTAERLRIPCDVLRTPEDQVPDAEVLDRALKKDGKITHVAVVHCETTTGILNPVAQLGATARGAGKVFIVDAMSSFGCLPIDFDRDGVDFLVTSPNKCLEGVPGFSIVFARRDLLLASEGSARSLSLDLLGQYQEFERSGQFRFTPPTHTILALARALDELDQEGGRTARLARYADNHELLLDGMRKLGIQPFLRKDVQSCIITAFHCPKDPHFSFRDLYHLLSDEGMIIYPGKLTAADTFRVGSIGRIFPADVLQLLAAFERALRTMGCGRT
ncbi:MAG: 2-aminoethylphosphonate--pyruvate transaminase [Verrucomicrobiia bacterium]